MAPSPDNRSRRWNASQCEASRCEPRFFWQDTLKLRQRKPQHCKLRRCRELHSAHRCLREPRCLPNCSRHDSGERDSTKRSASDIRDPTTRTLHTTDLRHSGRTPYLRLWKSNTTTKEVPEGTSSSSIHVFALTTKPKNAFLDRSVLASMSCSYLSLQIHRQIDPLREARWAPTNNTTWYEASPRHSDRTQSSVGLVRPVL